MILRGSRVYFGACFAANGLDMQTIKIGLAIRPDERVLSVSSGLPFSCKLLASVPGDYFLEKFVQMWFRTHNIGGEYFHDCDEIQRIVAHARTHKRLPFPVYEERAGLISFHQINVPAYMEKHGITFEEVEREAGARAQTYRKLIEREPCGNRRFLAALAVAAVRRGLSVTWTRDFVPSAQEQALVAA